MMVKKLSNIGNSKGIIIPKNLLDLIDATEDTVFKLDVDSSGKMISLKALSEEEVDEIVFSASNKINQEQSEVFKKLAE